MYKWCTNDVNSKTLSLPNLTDEKNHCIYRYMYTYTLHCITTWNSFIKIFWSMKNSMWCSIYVQFYCFNKVKSFFKPWGTRPAGAYYQILKFLRLDWNNADKVHCLRTQHQVTTMGLESPTLHLWWLNRSDCLRHIAQLVEHLVRESSSLPSHFIWDRLTPDREKNQGCWSLRVNKIKKGGVRQFAGAR